MKGDFSRDTFDVTKHFRRVLMQQGRVQLDADWNEQTAILLHYLQSLATDLIGPYAGPKENCGFAIEAIEKISDDFKIGSGHYYVDGILVELEVNSVPIVTSGKVGATINQIKVPGLTINNLALKEGQYLEVFDEKAPTKKALVKITHVDSDGLVLTVDPGFDISADALKVQLAATYTTQDDYPLPIVEMLDKDNIYLVYLDLWERHITYIEDDSIREVALGGPDTATRAKVVWQVKTTDKAPDGKNKLNKVLPPLPQKWRDWVYDAKNHRWSDWKNQWQPENRGMLKARAKQDRKKDTDPCITSPEASFRGTENQLYRVEIHKGGIAWDGKNENNKDKSATFKWSRDNGCVVTGIKLSGTELTVDNPRGLSAGQWLELTNDGQELRGEVGTLVKIKKIDCDILSLDLANAPTPKAILPAGEDWPTKARLWEKNEILIIENDKDWITLADGVQIQFQPSTPENQYRTGDYWLIPARVATGDVEWPGAEGNPEALPPHGVEHHYAPLAIIKINNGQIGIPEDLRWQIKELVQQPHNP